MAVLPLFGGANVPRLVKAGLAFALATLWFGNVVDGPPSRAAQPGGGDVVLRLRPGGLRETVLGALLGYAFGLFQVPARVAGEFLTEELGLSFGAFIDPTGTGNVSALTQILDALGILLFLGLDGHHLFLAALDATFTRYPVGAALPSVPIQPLVAGASLYDPVGPGDRDAGGACRCSSSRSCWRSCRGRRRRSTCSRSASRCAWRRGCCCCS